MRVAMLAYLLTRSAGGVPVYMAAVLVAGNPAGLVPTSSTRVLDLATDRAPSIASSSVQTATFADILLWSHVRPEPLPDGNLSMHGMRPFDATDCRGTNMTGTPSVFAYEPALLTADADGSTHFTRAPAPRDRHNERARLSSDRYDEPPEHRHPYHRCLSWTR